MTGVLAAKRQATAWLIAENPAEIIVTRREFVQSADGGRTEQVTVLSAFQGRLVPTGRQGASVRWDEAGKMHLFDWSLVAPWSADVEVGDTFLANNRNFRVLRVVQRKYTGEVYSVHAELEEVG